jgi:sulfotransferase family protein
VEWLVRTGMRNVQWVRAEGFRRLIEEHELHPVRRAAVAAQKARWRRAHPLPAGEAAGVFLTGVPRSGTNMMVRGLGASPEFEVRNEGDRLAFHRYRLRPIAVVRDLVLASGHRFVLFKPLLDSHRIPSLLDGLGTMTAPKAVWAYRNVDGRVHSALSKFGPAATSALSAIASGAGSGSWQAQGLSGESLELIRSVRWETATDADGVALLWYVKNRLFFEMGLDRRPDVHLVSYDALVREPASTMRALCEFLGAAWDERLSAHIDRRAQRGRDAVPLDPRLRGLCDDLSAELDAVLAGQHR